MNKEKHLITRTRIMLIIWISLALSFVFCVVYVMTGSNIPFYLAWGLFVPLLLCFFLLHPVRRLRHPPRRVQVHRRYYGYVENDARTLPRPLYEKRR